jgi:hypothetical protein
VILRQGVRPPTDLKALDATVFLYALCLSREVQLEKRCCQFSVAVHPPGASPWSFKLLPCSIHRCRRRSSRAYPHARHLLPKVQLKPELVP